MEEIENKYSIETLKSHLREKHNLLVDPSQNRDLRNIGYYHGYKGYRFIRDSKNPLKIDSFKQIVILNNFDMHLKGIFYPELMFIENALKSYVIEVTLEFSKTENLREIYKTALTYYQEFDKGSRKFKIELNKKLELEKKINTAISRDYMQNRKHINHFYNRDEEIPIWAAFESLTLGEFGTFFSCSNKTIRMKVSEMLNLPSKYNSDGFLLSDIVFTLKNLRNAIAHNGIIFDTRFKSGIIPQNIKLLLEEEFGIKNFDFNYISTYIALVVFMLNKMNETKECKSFTNQYETLTRTLERLPLEARMQIKGSQDEAVIDAIKKYLD